MGKARDISKLFSADTTIVTQSELDSIVFISSASPTSGNIDGRLWIDISTASAPVIQTYGDNLFRTPKLTKFKALGGTITESGIYTIHTFLSSGIFRALEPLTVEYLVVAGGGAGGQTPNGSSGGGGAGGYRTSTLSISAGDKTVTVGAGGVAANNTQVNGNNSVFDSITSIGGGCGGVRGITNTGAAGGSGGGGAGSENSAAGGVGTSQQGFAGGNGSPSGSNQGGGGGGASAAGTNGTSTVRGNGGNGLENSISGSPVTYAGGGGGGGGQASSGGTGGSGGGGTGTNDSGTSGTANTGGGGGGSGNNGDKNAGNGGSGIVIIRYLT